jgi:hypothetical protein
MAFRSADATSLIERNGMKTKSRIAVVAAVALSGFGVVAGGVDASPTDGTSAYSVDVKPDQPQRLQGRSVHMTARITSHLKQTISSYVLVKTHHKSWLAASPHTSDFAAGQEKTIRYSAHHAGIRRALRHGYSRAAKLVIWVADGHNGGEITHTELVRFRISPQLTLSSR